MVVPIDGGWLLISLVKVAKQLPSFTTNHSVPPTCHMNFSSLDLPGPSSMGHILPTWITLLLIGRLSKIKTTDAAPLDKEEVMGPEDEDGDKLVDL